MLYSLVTKITLKKCVEFIHPSIYFLIFLSSRGSRVCSSISQLPSGYTLIWLSANRKAHLDEQPFAHTWGQLRVPGVHPRRSRENMQSSHRKAGAGIELCTARQTCQPVVRRANQSSTVPSSRIHSIWLHPMTAQNKIISIQIHFLSNR